MEITAFTLQVQIKTIYFKIIKLLIRHIQIRSFILLICLNKDNLCFKDLILKHQPFSLYTLLPRESLLSI